MFTGISSKIILVQFALMAAMAGAGYLYFKHSQGVIETLTADKAKLEGAVATQQATIAAQQAAAARQNEANFALQQQVADADRVRRDLESTLRRRNLEAMARSNSADLEQRINRATATVFRDIETLTAPQDRPVPPPAQSQAPQAPSQPASTGTAGSGPSAPVSSSQQSAPTNNQPPPRPPVRSGAPGASP